MLVTESNQLLNLDNSNKFIGVLPELKNSKIKFDGVNNIIYCDEGVKISDSSLNFKANNSIIYLCKSRHVYKLVIDIYNNSTVFIGKNCYFNNPMHIILSEQNNCIIGEECLFSIGIWFRTGDPHLIYDIPSYERINYSKSIFIGDHVWIGQNSMILKNTRIDSGSIIGAMSLVSNKKIGSNEIWGGNPAKLIKNNIFWNNTCVHSWIGNDTEKSKTYDKFIGTKNNEKLDEFIYMYNRKQYIDFDDLENKLNKLNVDKKFKYLNRVLANPEKNRFVSNK